MKHLRMDYDSIQPFHPGAYDVEQKRIPADEPVFLLRASDAYAPDVVRYWAECVRAGGGDPDMCDAVEMWADYMAAYGRERHGGGKVPDVDPDLLREAL